MKSGNSSRAGSAPDKRVGIELELIEIEAGAYRFDLSLPVADARRSQELFVSHMNVRLLLCLLSTQLLRLVLLLVSTEDLLPSKQNDFCLRFNSKSQSKEL